MVRHDTSDSNMKTIHLKSRKAVDIWNKWRNRGDNLSETIANFLIQEEERQQEIAKANGQVLDEEQEQQNRVRPPFDFSFVVDPRHYKDERKWMHLLKYAKDQEILDLHDMLEYALKRTTWKAEKIRKEEDTKKLALYREQREIERQEWEAVQKAMQEEHDKVHKPKMYAILDDTANNSSQEANEERAKKYIQTNIDKCSSCRKIYDQMLKVERELELEQQQQQQQQEQPN